jgi:hypothetical protein
LGDGRDRDGVAVEGEVGAGAFDLVQSRGHPVCVSVSAIFRGYIAFSAP